MFKDYCSLLFTALPSAAPAVQLDVCTEEHLLFIMPQVLTCVIAITDMRLSKNWVFNIWCWSVRFTFSMRCCSSVTHALCTKERFKWFQLNSVKASRHSQRALLKSVTAPLSYTAGVNKMPPRDEIQKADMMQQHKDTEWRHIKHTAVWLVWNTFTF